MVLRRIMRKSTLGDEEFDPIVHADLHFVDVISTLLDLIISPRNLMQHTSLERTAATFSAVVTLNNLFLSSDDIIDLACLKE
ncbi:hypothetical protein BCV72DRAFT_305922 [Rhizopus microsporus var. microsporus]|uniref:Uncharacterized protein n=2 Tax=Rhizopus microsporus TaxID=58291 RepID=A0A2G4T434_RHIZD|nr:uncharacterized protein RHIMIDRAFT_235112 [Rhizopus microsporus ATCC 52813]ORE05982.1 hypothetical protein BCV72DRAFT_305922 [Rhizopus microsporus var. microsporus]PHZ15772.1 hypothetical protein RHIMIDRAFT_235112 [Rhizopus microsporus ATCC 52813]